MLYKPAFQIANFANTHLTPRHRAMLKLLVVTVMLALMATGVLADGTGNGTCGNC
jgi:hypothetical protein